MAIFKKLDYWSITDNLDKMLDYCYEGNLKNSPYWDFYSDQINELSCLAADFYNDLDEIKRRLWQRLPERNIGFCEEDGCTQTAISWFNTAVAMLDDTDMETLLENENRYRTDPEIMKEKRIAALNRLTKAQQMFLYSTVMGFITRYLELQAAFDAVEAVVSELDFHQSAISRGNGVQLPQPAYLA